MSFKVEAFQNRFLALGQTRVDAILQVTAPGEGGGPTPKAGGPLVLGFIIDKSGSMNGERIESVKKAVWQAISLLNESSWFFVVAFDAGAHLIVRESQATAENKRAAGAAIAGIGAGGGTAMSTGLELARQLFARAPDAIRQAVFLTDGKNESEAPGSVHGELARCEGTFQCDCWGVGTDWRVGEVQEIAGALLGKASLIPGPEGIESAFKAAMAKASSKALKDVKLRIWTPAGAEVVFVKQVNPTIEELTSKGKVVSPQVREYMTGAWSSGESRDFQVAINVKAGGVQDEMLAARPSVAYLEAGGSGWAEHEDKPAEARLFANWTQDDVSFVTHRQPRRALHRPGRARPGHPAGMEAREHGQEAQRRSSSARP